MTWLKSLELHRLAGMTMSGVFAFGAIYIVVTQTLVVGEFSPTHILFKTHFIDTVALSGVFFLSGTFRALRWIQPIVTGLIVLISQVFIPETYVPFLFFTITSALLIRYDFFRVWALPKGAVLLLALLISGVTGELVFGRPILLAFELVVVILGLSVFLYLFFSQYIDPHLGPPKPPVFYILQDHGFTRLEASILEHLLRPQETVKEIAGLYRSSESTIRNHLQSIYRKTGSGHTRAELIDHLSGMIVVWDQSEVGRYGKKRRKATNVSKQTKVY